MAPATPPTAAPATDREATNGWILTTDIFVEVLLLLPATKRWRLRIVCRHWRDVIHERTPPPEWRSQPTPLVFFQNYSRWEPEVSASVFVIDNPAEGRGTELWRTEHVAPEILHHHPKKPIDAFGKMMMGTMMVGTCNGLLCLCDNTKPGGAVSLLNPATGESLALPPLPGSAQWVWWGMQLKLSGWHEAYSFAYEPMAEEYKVVHLPCYLDRSGGFSAAQVFVLGKSASAWAWRDVPTPGASCRLDAGVVSVLGVTYWLTKAAERVVAFDVREERVASCMALPAKARRGYVWHLAEVDGRLGLISTSYSWVTPEKIDVWVLVSGGGGDRRREWSRWYNVQLDDGVKHWIGCPRLAHGDYVLTEDSETVFLHRLKRTGRWSCGEVLSVRVGERMPGVEVVGVFGRCIRGVFAYIQTKEPLSVYNPQAS
ncbi:unnamed protein product [Urochloa humidicola]